MQQNTLVCRKFVEGYNYGLHIKYLTVYVVIDVNVSYQMLKQLYEASDPSPIRIGVWGCVCMILRGRI